MNFDSLKLRPSWDFDVRNIAVRHISEVYGREINKKVIAAGFKPRTMVFVEPTDHCRFRTCTLVFLTPV